MGRKDKALDAVVMAAEGAAALDAFYPGSAPHYSVGRNDVAVAVTEARAAGATDDEIRTAVRNRAFKK